ncbi:hypothetical protein [Glycomyces sp. NPDC047010]|uniref:hypothetical protein n=1 Tax=Glycomyces sp. NPDC047010 TaxID=3155023 RepID=UPI00340F2F1C
MTRYFISFDEGTMVIPEADLAAVGEAAHAVVAAAKAAGAWVTGGGVIPGASVVAVDGSVTESPAPEAKATVGGFVVLDLGSHAEALDWAGRFAAACRCAQEVRALMDDPEA